MDLFSRKIVGWAVRDHMQVELASAAPTMAVNQQRPQDGWKGADPFRAIGRRRATHVGSGFDIDQSERLQTAPSVTSTAWYVSRDLNVDRTRI